MKNKNRDYLLLSFITILFLFFLFPERLFSAEKIRIGSPFKEGHILVEAAKKFKEILEKESGGRFEVEIQAGVESEEKINELNSKGQIEMQSNGHRALEIFGSKYFCFNAPYVMKDFEHFIRVWEGSLGKKAREEVEKNGIVKYLGIVYRGLRQTTANKPIYNPADVYGLKLRLPTVKTWIAVWKEIGADPIPIPLPELYESLKTGRAEASEGDLPQISSFKLDEVQKYLIITNHLVQTGGMMVNKDFFNKLSKEDQNLLINAVKQACDWANDTMKRGENALLVELQRKGLQVIIPDAESFRMKARPTVEDLFKTEWPVTTWEEILAQ
ncbi:MAG: TRAP transporter substrate-binding protein [Deltaproteobacteria bacterium]|nr:TRAP transporter substrate-binding protein [Deltaproteobacteria bacterium]